MAIPFLQPEEDESVRNHGGGAHPNTGSTGVSSTSGGASGSGTAAAGHAAGGVGAMPIPASPAPSGTSTAVQTPLIGPMNGDHLVQLFYEALYRYSRGDTPSTPISQSPQSSSCSPFTTGYYNGQVFFPQTPNGVQQRPGGRGVFFGQPTPSPSGSSSHSSQNSANSPDTPSCSSAPPIYHQFPANFSMASSSSSTAAPVWSEDVDESSESDSSQPSSGAGCSPHCVVLPAHSPLHHHHHQPQLQLHDGSSGSGSTMGLMPANGFIPPHLDYMAGREQLQEFAGKIPQRKKKSKTNKSKKSRFLEQTLVWPTLAVTATLIALGCGLLAAR